MLKKPPTRHLPVSRFPLLMARSGLGLKYMFYFKYIKRNKQKQKYVLNIIYYIKTKILIKNNLKHAQKTANPSPPSLKISLTHGKIWSGVKIYVLF